MSTIIVVGSGAGASVVAWHLATTGHDVLILEKGRNLLRGLGSPEGVGPVPFGNDEVKAGRAFENQDSVLEPRTARTQSEAAQGVERSFVGDVNDLPTTVGGGTIHWDAKTPRFWRQDFKGRSLYGPVAGANVADWPLTYEELAPYYDEIERRLGVQGDADKMPPRSRDQMPRSGPFPMPPNPPMLAGLRLAEGARRLGYTAYPFPMAVNSTTYDGRPPCNSCGFCSGFGCPISARGGAAVSFLHHALAAGARLRPRSFVHRVDMSGGRATGVSWLDPSGVEHHEAADVVVLAASAIETARLLLLSNIGNRSGQVGRNLMFHLFTVAGALFTDDLHAWRGPSTTFVIDDFVGPDRPPAAATAGLPYVKGGLCETGGTTTAGPLSEAGLYTSVPNSWGVPLKRAMREALWRKHVVGLSMVGEDLPQEANRVDLDPHVKDVLGLPVPRITYSNHNFELVASSFYGPKLAALCGAAPGAVGSSFIPVGAVAAQTGASSSALAGAASTAHIMGTCRMGDDPARSVTDGFGRLHDVENVWVADGALFTSSGGFNPTLTIMALALRAARAVAGQAPLPAQPPRPSGKGAIAATGGPEVAVAGAAAIAAGLAARRAGRQSDG
jgi:choline dehydrogenase-like flavoprotein